MIEHDETVVDAGPLRDGTAAVVQVAAAVCAFALGAFPPRESDDSIDAAWRRVATVVARRKTAPKPVARRTPVDGARGALVLIGGGCSPDGDALGAFIRLAGADHGAPIVGFTTASSSPAARRRRMAP